MTDKHQELVEALSGGVSELAEAGRNESAEATGVLLLGIDEQAARDAFVDEIERLDTVSSRPLTRAILETVARHRHSSDWPRWLNRISTDTVAQLDDGPGLTGALARKLWLEATKEENPVGNDALTAALTSAQRLASKIDVDRTGLVEEIGEAVAAAPLDESSASAQAEKLKLGARFAEANLVRREDYAPAALGSIATVLGQQWGSVELNHPISRHVERWGTDLAPAGDDPSRDQLREAAGASPWLQSPFRDSLYLAGSLRDNPAEAVSTYSHEQILALVEEHGEWFDSGLAIWIGELERPSAAAVGKVIAPFRGDEVPDCVVAAIKERFTNSAQRAELAVEALREMLNKPPGKDFLAAIEIEKADPAPIVDLLAELYGEAANNEQRESIFAVAEAMTPLPDPQRKQLITEIAIPMAHQGKGALDIVLAHLKTCLPPPYGTRQKLRNTLRERAKDKEQRARVEKALLEAGMTRRSGFFGRGREDVEE